VKVTPLDIRRKEFKRSMRGYSDEEVDVFLDDVADEFERLFQENIELNDRVERLQEQISGHVQMKDALEKTLISAQLQSDEMKANARKESELILQEAELKAREIVRDSYGETQRVQQALIQLKHLEEDFRFKFRSLLEGHLKLLNEAPIGAPSSESRALTGEVGGEAETPLVVPSPETAEPEMVASDMVASEMVPSAMAASEMSAADPFEEVAAPEDEIPTEETFTDEVAVAVAAADDSGNGAAEQGAVYSASTDSAEETTGETLVAASAPESTAESRTGETVLPQAPPPASVAPAPVAPPRAAPETSMAATGETEIDETDEPTGGFFFGRQPDDIDDTFVPPEDEPEKARDFEW
jgi:cell division initiation protein